MPVDENFHTNEIDVYVGEGSDKPPLPKGGMSHHSVTGGIPTQTKSTFRRDEQCSSAHLHAKETKIDVQTDENAKRFPTV